jgi:hypothetical protein
LHIGSGEYSNNAVPAAAFRIDACYPGMVVGLQHFDAQPSTAISAA